MFGKVQIAPSLLSADFCNLERDVRMIEEGCPEWLHVDVMDGHFVPNLTIGSPVIKALKKITNIKLDVHLMISNTADQLDSFLVAGADMVTIHVENGNGPARGASAAGASPSIEQVDDPHEIRILIDRIHAHGAMAGISLNPGTPASAIDPFITSVDLVLVMSVHPGFGGQSFIEDSLDKIEQLIEMAKAKNVNPIIEVDGGINAKTAALVVAKGADMLVAGNAIFAAADPIAAMTDIRAAARN